MKYFLHLSDKSSTSEASIEKSLAKWNKDSFYTSDLVLGLDIGMEGLGIWLRKGSQPIFAQTVLVELPKASPLAERRAKRAGRRARVSRKKREDLLKKWIVKHGLLSAERVEEIWHNPDVFKKGFEHRYRAIQKKDTLKSPEALVSAVRHCIKHRGYDYHLSNDASFPWGDSLDDHKAIIQWARRAICPRSAVENWKRIFSDAVWSDDEKKRADVETALDETVRRYDAQPIEKLLAEHFSEKGHPNLRTPARGENFPRELIKAHLRKICTHHLSFFKTQKNLDAALLSLLGKSDNKIEPDSIIDFHRKTQEEIELLWERKTNDCPYLPNLSKAIRSKAGNGKCSPNSSPEIRRFKLLQFLAERTFVVAGKTQTERLHANADLYGQLSEILAKDIAATTASSPTSPTRPKIGKRELKKLVEDTFSVKLSKTDSSHNTDFFDQLHDLLSPKLSVLKDRASLSATAAAALCDEALPKGEGFDAGRIRSVWQDTYYQWRRTAASGGPSFPQVDILLGHPSQYAENGRTTLDLNNGNPQHHGILRRLFARQFRDAHGNLVDISQHLEGKEVPDAVIIETIGDIPRNEDQRKEFQKEQKERRDAKEKILAKYSLSLDSTSEQIKRAFLFDQQADKNGHAICPYTGDDLGSDPLAKDLEIEHIFPREMGGISEMLNLVLTRRQTNADKGKNTPFQIKDKTIGKTTFSPWDEMKKRAETSMRWNKDKRALFCREETGCPQWANLTRTAQLARQLRDRVIQWLGLHSIKDDNTRANEIARRIGTPSGAMTAACRSSWKDSLPEFMRGKKDRSYLRHHLYDAAVLSFIPPGKGMNLSDYGGIFFSDFDPKKGWKTLALPSLLPDLDSFERDHKTVCLVFKPKNTRNKTSRYDGTIYSPVDEEGTRWTRFLGSLMDWKHDKKITLEKIIENIRAAGIDPKRLPDKMIRQWYASENDALLRFPSFKQGVPGQTIKTVTRKISKPCAEPAYGPHYDEKGNIIGWKVAQEAFIRCDLFKLESQDEKGKPTLTYYQRRILHPRHVRNLEKRTLSDGRRITMRIPLSEADLREIGLIEEADSLLKTHQSQTAKWEKDAAKKNAKSTGQCYLFETDSEIAQTTPPQPLTTTLQTIYCEPIPIPADATKLGSFQKGRVFMIPLDPEGKFYKRGTLPKNGPVSGWWAYGVSAIKSNGSIKMSLSEMKEINAEKNPCGIRQEISPSSRDDLAYIIEIQSITKDM